MKHKSEKAVRSAAQETLLVGHTTADTTTHMEDNDYKESLKVKAQSQVLLMDGKRRFLEEKKAAEEEAQRRQRRVEEQEAAQKEMSKLLAEAEKRQAEKQRLLSESQLQTEILQRKALEAAKRADDMISQNEQEMQRLLEEANRKKALAEQLKKEEAEEARQAQIQAEMMRQLEEQRKERERLEREEAARKREQEEIAALKAALQKKLQGSSVSLGVTNKTLTILIFLSIIVVVAWLAIGGNSVGAALPLALQHMIGVNAFHLNPIQKTLALEQMDDHLSRSLDDIDVGLSVINVLKRPQERIMTALSGMTEASDFAERQLVSKGRTDSVTPKKRSGVIRGFLHAIISPMRLLSTILKKLLKR